jgi:hypothetical protein
LNGCRFYDKLAGMTGTAAPAAAELFELYGLKVSHKPACLEMEQPVVLAQFQVLTASSIFEVLCHTTVLYGWVVMFLWFQCPCLFMLHPQVAQVPTNRPIQRADLASRFYFIPAERTQALCNLVVTCWKKGR